MPSRPKISLERIVEAAAALANVEGVDGLSMEALASRLGVKAPSLYKHLRDKAALRRLLAHEALRKLSVRFATIDPELDDGSAVDALARAYRAFALAHPGLYRLMVHKGVDDDAPLRLARAAALGPLLARLEKRGLGVAEALASARAITAALHGFVDLEIADAFRLGGSVEDAFETLVSLLVSTLRMDAADSVEKVRFAGNWRPLLDGR